MRQNDDAKTVAAMDMLVPRVLFLDFVNVMVLQLVTIVLFTLCNVFSLGY